MAARMLRKLTAAALLVGASVGLSSQAVARPTPGVRVARPLPTRRTFNLFAGAPQSNYRPNRVQCGVINNGTACVDPSGSPVNENGFWPAGSPDNYIFNSGLQIAGFIPTNAGFAWAGDTVGAYFFDPRGDQHHGEGLTNVYDAKNADDVANWPTAGDITDTALFATTLLARHTASQEDLWYRYWDGNTSLQAGRKHTMGLLVDQRFMGWNYPAGNNDILYTIVRFINITSGNRSDYDNLSQYGYSTADIDAIYQIALNFRATSQAFYNVSIPQGGFQWDNVFASYAGDFDEGDANHNFSMGNLIFSTVVNYKSDFNEPTWQLPPSIFSAPFLAGPGMAAIKYLKSPGTGGISMMGNTTNGGSFPDAQGIPQLWRHLSGDLITADGVSCDIPNGTNPDSVRARRQCFWATSSQDTRIYGASGPFSVAPGQAASTAVALVFAASVAKMPAATPGIASNAPLPAFDLTTSQGTDFPPTKLSGSVYGIDGTRLLQNKDTLAPIDRVMGFINYTADNNANGRIDQSEVITTPRSLLDKEKVAQTVYDNKFLLPFAPSTPTFFLVPGDGKVTVAWQQSESETAGNPFYQIASQPLLNGSPNALYDPNFRNFDVEGYRIWRGRTSSDMAVIAQFDYAGSTMLDYTAEFFDETTYGNACAPELGIQTSCPVAYDTTTPGVPVWTTATPVAIPLNGVVRQIPPGGRVALANGTVFNISVDTAVTGGASGYPGLSDNGVPFAFQDNSVVNGVRYFYAVTAFSINSLKSGPSSLESQIVPKTTTPRAASTNNVPAVVVTGMFGGDGVQLDAEAQWPAIDAAAGTFSGETPIPPANAGSFGFLASVAEALPPGDLTARIDSVGPGMVDGLGVNFPTLFLTLSSDTLNVRLQITLPVSAFNGAVGFKGGFSASAPLAPYDSARSAALGISRSFSLSTRMPVLFQDTTTGVADQSPSNAMATGRYGNGNTTSRYLAHSRWFDEGGSEPADPTIAWRPDKTHNAGQLTGVDSIENIQVYRQPSSGAAATDPQFSLFERGYIYGNPVWYPADFVVTWGAGGSITVRDSTHHTDLPYEPYAGIGYGFVSLANITGAGLTAGDLDDGDRTASITKLQYHSLYSTSPVCYGYWGITCADLAKTATLSPIDYNDDDVADGNGILLIVNGEPFLMKMAALPAAGTKWHLRAFGGHGMTATCTPALPNPTDCSGYSWSPISVRPALAPGLQFKIRVTQAFSLATNSGDLSNVHTVPDPYYVTNSLEQTANTKILRFVNLPSQAIVRIYSTSGILVRILTHNDPAGGGEEVWDLRNRNNQFVASGVYFYHVEASDGKTKVGRFTVVNFAQ